MRVRAIKKGYYGLLLREPGTPSAEFTLKDEAGFSKKWMEPVSSKKRKDADEEEPESKGSKAQAKTEKSVI